MNRWGLIVQVSPRAHVGGGVAGLQPPPPSPQNQSLKDTNFVYIMILKVIRDFPLRQNQPLKSGEDQYIRILKNKLMK
jgi:hypothetical protein